MKSSPALTRLSALDLADRKEKQPKPPTLYDISAEIRRVGGTVWLVQTVTDGTLLRAELRRIQFRVAVGIPGQSAPPVILAEANSALYIVHDLPGLTAFLSTIYPKKNG